MDELTACLKSFGYAYARLVSKYAILRQFKISNKRFSNGKYVAWPQSMFVDIYKLIQRIRFFCSFIIIIFKIGKRFLLKFPEFDYCLEFCCLEFLHFHFFTVKVKLYHCKSDYCTHLITNN